MLWFSDLEDLCIVQCILVLSENEDSGHVSRCCGECDTLGFAGIQVEVGSSAAVPRSPAGVGYPGGQNTSDISLRILFQRRRNHRGLASAVPAVDFIYLGMVTVQVSGDGSSAHDGSSHKYRSSEKKRDLSVKVGIGSGLGLR